MAFGASRGDQAPVETRRRGPRARAVGRPYGQGPALGVGVTPPAAVTGDAAADAGTAAPAVQPPGRVRGSVRGVRGGASLDAQSLVARYRNLAVTSDATAAAAAGLVALAVRFGVHWPPAYVLVTALLPGVLDRHGYAAARLRGALPRQRPRGVPRGPRSPRWRSSRSSPSPRTSCAADVSRTYVLLAVPALLLVLSLLGRHALRTWTYRLRAAGQGLQRVLVVGRADAAVAVIEKLRQEPQHGLHAVAACVPPAAGVEVSHVGGVPGGRWRRHDRRRRRRRRRARRRGRLAPRPGRRLAAPAVVGAGGARGRAGRLAGHRRGRRARGCRSARSRACRCSTSSGRRSAAHAGSSRPSSTGCSRPSCWS